MVRGRAFVVLDSSVQIPHSLQGQHALTVCAVYRSSLFFSGGLCLFPDSFMGMKVPEERTP